MHHCLPGRTGWPPPQLIFLPLPSFSLAAGRIYRVEANEVSFSARALPHTPCVFNRLEHWHDSCPFLRVRRNTHMLYYALIFLVVGLIAGVLGLFGVAQIASQIAWILFVVGIVMLIIHLVTGRGRGPQAL